MCGGGSDHQPRDHQWVTLISAQQVPRRPRETGLGISKGLVLCDDPSNLVGNIYLNKLLDSCTNSFSDVCAKERLLQSQIFLLHL